MDFTNAQLEAICCRGSSVLVSAGAGSGKTRVLTERLMEYMDPQHTDARPEDIDRFLVITFTRAAAGELRARVTSAIAARLRQNPHNAHLRRHVESCLREMAEEILAGSVAVNPSYVSESENACRNCPYHQICRFEEGENGEFSNPTPRLDDAAVWARLQEEKS